VNACQLNARQERPSKRCDEAGRGDGNSVTASRSRSRCEEVEGYVYLFSDALLLNKEGCQSSRKVEDWQEAAVVWCCRARRSCVLEEPEGRGVEGIITKSMERSSL